jgi:cytoskeletal protein RodZ
MSIPPVAMQSYPRPTPMPGLDHPNDPTAQSASNSARVPEKNRKLQLFIVLAILSVLVPLATFLVKNVFFQSEDHGDSQVVPEIERSIKPTSPGPPPSGSKTVTAPTPAAAPATPPAETKVASKTEEAPSGDADADDEPEKPAAKPAKAKAGLKKNAGKAPRIYVTSTPAKATVERDGKKIGLTPVWDSPPAGRKSVRYRISAKGYKPYEESLSPSQKKSLTAKLKPEKS